MISERKREQLIKSNLEQATASWINYLNQIRFDAFFAALKAQDAKLAQATNTIDATLATIKNDIIIRNRGGAKGMHGFVAEVAECGISNARQEIVGNASNCVWINDNGPADLIRDGVQIQQKFVNSGNHLSLYAIRKHFTAYPWFLDQGGNIKYQRIIIKKSATSSHCQKKRHIRCRLQPGSFR